MKYVTSRIDWSKRADYIRDRHFVEPAWADEAVTDPEACWLAPDPASASGLSVRVIGYSGQRGRRAYGDLAPRAGRSGRAG